MFIEIVKCSFKPVGQHGGGLIAPESRAEDDKDIGVVYRDALPAAEYKTLYPDKGDQTRGGAGGNQGQHYM